jgi:hypothetical protein
MFKAPARALLKNALVVSIGFLPLFVSPLVPYNTVGFFMFMIMLVAGLGTVLILPAIITGFPRAVFEEGKVKMVCACGRCVLMAVLIALTVVYVLLGYKITGLNATALIAIAVVAVLSGVCAIVSRHRMCVAEPSKERKER